ncbi:MAG: CRISPR-associated endonuclease Cas3'', partial [candidate division WOR-3 bacterium]
MKQWFDLVNDIWAHSSENKYETLNRHIECVFKYLNTIKDTYNLSAVIKNICKYALNLDVEIVERYILEIVKYHDIGKVNPLYQIEVLKNNNLIDKNIILSKIGTSHSSLSFFIFLEYLFKNKEDFKTKHLEFIVIIILSTIILQHHTDLKNLNFSEIGLDIEYKKEDFKKVYKYWDIDIDNEIFSYIGKNFFDKLDLIIKRKCDFDFFSEEQLTYLYFLFKLANSLLISSDFYATLEFKKNKEFNFNNCIINDNLKKILIKKFHFTKSLSDGSYNFNFFINQNKQKITSDNLKNFTHINDIRNWLNVQTEKNLEEALNKNYNLFYLNLPTGSGKTNISYRLALKILEKDKNIKKIYYVFPFINIIEQSYSELGKFIPEESRIRLDSKSPIKIEVSQELENKEDLLEKIYVDSFFMNYPILFLSNVKFFDMFFKNEKNSNFNFYQLSNSIVILDEIQSYDDTLWVLLAEIIFKISRVL